MELKEEIKKLKQMVANRDATIERQSGVIEELQNLLKNPPVATKEAAGIEITSHDFEYWELDFKTKTWKKRKKTGPAKVAK